MKKKVSIIIPAYNVEQYIKKSILSCCNQTYSNIEILVVDDGSTDNTWEEIGQITQYDTRIKAAKQENGGVAVARNTALDMATGDFVLFLDADDWLEDNAVESLLHHVKPEIGLVCSDCYFVYARAGGQIKECQNSTYTEERCTQHKLMQFVGKKSKFRLVSSCYKLFKRKIIEDNHLRFKAGIAQGEDGLFTFQYICHINCAYYYPELLWNIFDRPGSSTNVKFNPNWISAISAVNLMLEYRPVTGDIYNNLRALRGERAMWVLINCLRYTDGKQYTEIIEEAKQTLRKDAVFLLKRDRIIKRMFQLLFLCVMPVSITKMLLRIKSSEN